MRDEELRRGLWVAMLNVCGIEERAVNIFNKAEYQQAERALWQAGATPGEVQRRGTILRNLYTVPLTPKFIARHWSEAARPSSSAPVVASGLFFHPDNCPNPCIGCAADRKATA